MEKIENQREKEEGIQKEEAEVEGREVCGPYKFQVTSREGIGDKRKLVGE